MAEYTALLEAIRKALNETGGSKSASELITEVRDSIRGGGEPTLARSILNLEHSIHTDLHEIRNILAGGAGSPAGRPATGVPGHEDELLHATREIGDRQANLERTVATLAEVLGHSAGGGAGGGHLTGFDLHAVSGRYKAAEEMATQATTSVSQALLKFAGGFTEINGPLHEQYAAHLKSSALELINFRTRTTDLIGIFEKLGGFIKNDIIEKYSGFLQNRSGNLSGIQYFGDDLKRMWDTLRGNREEMGYGMVNTQEGVKKSIGEGLTSPLLTYGKSIEQLSVMYKQTMDRMEKMGVDAHMFGSPQQLQQLIDVLVERQKSTGPLQDMRSIEMTQTLSASTKYLIDIARYTNMSADELTKLVKANTQTASELTALGVLSQKEAARFTEFQTGLQGLGTGGKYMSDMLTKWMASGQDRTMFFHNNKEAVQADAQSGGALTQMLAQLGRLSTREGDAKSKIQETRQIAESFAAAAGKGTGDAVTVALHHDNPMYAQTIAAMTQVGNNSAKLADVPEKDMAAAAALWVENFKNIFGIFGTAVTSFGGAVGGMITHMVDLAGAVYMLRRLGVGAAPVPAASAPAAGRASTLGRFTRYGGALAAGAAGAYNAASEGSSPAGIAGAGVGGTLGTLAGTAGAAIVGRLVGTAIGGLTSWFTGPFGMIIGGAVGSIIGSKLGQYLGDNAISSAKADTSTEKMATMMAQRPVDGSAEKIATMIAQRPVDGSAEKIATLIAQRPQPSDMVGPEASAIAGATTEAQRAFQERQVVIMSGLLDATNVTNSILSQMYGELQKQSAAAGAPSSPSNPPIGRGLSVAAPSVANPGRADAGTPQSSIGS